MKKELVLRLLFLVLALEIVGEILFIFYEIPYVLYVFKPLLMPLLAYWYLLNISKPNKVLLYALLFSWFGDVFLMFLPLSPHFFMAGLASFLVTHVLYVYIFVKYVDASKPNILKRRPHLMLPFILFGFSLLAYLMREAYPEFVPIKIPVIIYATIIMIMVIAAITRFERVTQSSFSLVLIGALLFMFSDTLIALNNFSPIFDNIKYVAKIGVMSMYVIGQYLIVKGLLANNEA